VAVKCVIRASQYYDSVTLMTVARDLRGLSSVEDAALMMGTDANKGLLVQADLFAPEAEKATSNDLIIAVKAGEDALEAALAMAEKLLTARGTHVATAGEHHPRTVRSAVRSHPESNVAVVSVSGQYAAEEAWAALRQGLHVLLFSDNVPLSDEIALKRYAVDNGLLMMGPGAGTAIINGVALAFANAVPRGAVGIVSAAGTGLQEVSSLLAQQGVGVSQGIGVGGRDLSNEVGGMMTQHAIDALQEDSETKVIVAISKLPSPEVAEKVLETLRAGEKPAVVAFMGEKLTPPVPASDTYGAMVYMASTLKEASLAAVTLVQGGNLATVQAQLEQEVDDLQGRAEGLRSQLKTEQKYLRGLFSGGTLCEEAMRIWGERLGAVWSNAPLKPECTLPDANQSFQHTALDLGEEEFTVGRPHPMIDNDLRIRRLMHEAGDPSVAGIQMDVVLGYGAHPNPASELAPAIERARQIAQEDGRSLIVILSITGTEGDPQNLNHQRAAFEKTGALVLENNAEASYLAAMLVGS
jgi:FdrA protein